MPLSFMFKASGAGCLLALAAIFAAGGCKSTPEDRQPVTVQDVQQPVDAVQDIVRRAEAASDDAQRARYYLRALERLHEAGDVARAKGIAETMRGRKIGQPASIADALAPEARFRFDAIGLDLALESGNIDEVDRLLAVLKPQGLNQDRQAMRLRARTFSAVGNVAGAAETLMALAEASTNPDTVETLAGSIWRHLTALPVLESRTRAKAAPSASARAWWTLAHDFNAALTRRGQVRAWQRWRSLHTGHPAARYPPPALVRTERDPDQLALLVPVTGDFGAAGEAVRDGFLAAYLYAGSVAQRVHVYDTGAMSVRAAYDLALRQGAEIVVGPLQKAEVAAMSALTPTVPVIALNHLDAGAPRSEFVVQFSLAVEDQALAIADALEADGVERIVLFDSPARWSSRARVRLEDELDGVEVVGFGTFHRVGQVTNTVGDALHVTESKARARAIESLLGTQLEFTPRRRDDVDAVVALVDADEFLSLKPALEFHFAGDLPVYAPATATLDGVDLSRLEGLRVCAIPWTLDPGALGAAVKAAFPASRGSYASLFALGVDGFRLANQYARLTVHREPIPANTGVLSLGDDGRIRRELVWATVRRASRAAVSQPQLNAGFVDAWPRRFRVSVRAVMSPGPWPCWLRRIGRLVVVGRQPKPSFVGEKAERRAERFLRRQGLRTLTRNYARRTGEIDLIMLDGDVVAFVEVRYRGARAWTTGAGSIDAGKQRRLTRTAELYLNDHPEHRHRTTRFDVVSASKGNYGIACEWIPNAFDAVDC